MSQARKILSNTAWQVIGKVVTAVLGIVSVKFITNYLTKSTYGEYTTIYDYTAMFAIIADFGLFTIAVREMAHSNEKSAIQKIVGNVLSMRTGLAIFALGIGALIAAVMPAYRGSHIPFGILLVSIATVFTLIAGTMSSVLQFHLRMKWASISILISKIFTVGYILATILYLYPNDPVAGFPHLLLGWIGGGLINVVTTYAASTKLIPISFQFDFKFWKEVLVKALPYGTALVLGTIYFRMGTVMLSLFEMKEQIGYYGVPMRFLEILQILPHYFMNSVLPLLTISLDSINEKTGRIVRYSIDALAAMAIPIMVGGYVLAWPITAAVSSPDFLTERTATGFIWGSDLALKILLVAMTFTYIHVALSYTLVAMGRQVELLWINGITVIVNVGLNLFLAPRYGFIGASISAAASELTMLACLFIRTKKRIRGIWDLPFLAKTAFSALVMGIVLNSITDYFNKLLFTKSLFILMPIGGIVFVACMLLTKAVSKDMWSLLRKTEPSEVREEV
ncbi:flippase [Candidatus Peregrinibacteria bacterium]|nr:flippase [Candidatus Peregrinibacteria bacterium]